MHVLMDKHSRMHTHPDTRMHALTNTTHTHARTHACASSHSRISCTHVHALTPSIRLRAALGQRVLPIGGSIRKIALVGVEAMTPTVHGGGSGSVCAGVCAGVPVNDMDACVWGVCESVCVCGDIRSGLG